MLGLDRDEAFASLRRPATRRAQRYELGRSLREKAPRSGLADWVPPLDRADPVDQVAAGNEGRVRWLVPIRVGRMAASPYAFLRGSAGIMADDFAGLPATGITPVARVLAAPNTVARLALPHTLPVVGVTFLLVMTQGPSRAGGRRANCVNCT